MSETASLVNGTCYASAAAATDAFFSQQLPVFSSGVVSYISAFQKDAGVWNLYQYSVDAAGVYTTRSVSVAVAPTFPLCDSTASFFDGMAIGWGISLAIIAAYSFVQLRKALA